MSRFARSSMLPVFAILVLALVVYFPVLRNWQPVARLLSFKPKTEAPPDSVKVWVNTRSGLYYCAASPAFGKIVPGETMTQGKALEKGYRPFQKEPCH